MIDTDFKALVEGIEVHLGNGTPSDSLGNNLDLFIDRDGRKFWRKYNGKWTSNALYVLGPLFLTLIPPVGVSPDVSVVPVYRNGSIEWSGDIGSLDSLAANAARLPNYSAGVSVLAAYTAGGNTYTAPTSGWFLARAAESQQLRVNGGVVIPAVDLNASRMFPVKAGDVLLGLAADGVSAGGALIHLNFFPERA